MALYKEPSGARLMKVVPVAKAQEKQALNTFLARLLPSGRNTCKFSGSKWTGATTSAYFKNMAIKLKPEPTLLMIVLQRLRAYTQTCQNKCS